VKLYFELVGKPIAFVVLICVERESSKRQTGLTCMNVTLLQLLCHYTAIRKLVGIPTSENTTYIRNGIV